MKYINADKLIAEIRNLRSESCISESDEYYEYAKSEIIDIITSLQQEPPANMIQWTGSNLKEVIDFTGKSPKIGEWFKSMDEFESYVHSHGDILKLFSEDGSHFEVPVGAWIVKTPDGYNVPSVARFIHTKQEQPEVDFETEYAKFSNDPDALDYAFPIDLADYKDFARHFFEHGLRQGMMKGANEKLAEVMQLAGFKPPFLDGNQYCTLFGIDLMRSFVGFGNTETESFIEALKDVKNFIEK